MKQKNPERRGSRRQLTDEEHRQVFAQVQCHRIRWLQFVSK
jgi:hypothetical protein